jgi:hypothetical protein
MLATSIGKLRVKLYVALGMPQADGTLVINWRENRANIPHYNKDLYTFYRASEAACAEQLAEWGKQHGTDPYKPWYAADALIPFLLQTKSLTNDEIDNASLCELAALVEEDSAVDTRRIKIESESDIPAEYRDGGLATGEPLTTDIIAQPEKYNLSAQYVSKKYRGPELKWGRKKVYRHAEIAALSDRKARRGDGA